LCHAKTAGFSIEVQTLIPREKSCPLIKMITGLGSLEGETHHGGRCVDGCANQVVGLIRIPSTNVSSPNEDVHVDQIHDVSGHLLMKTKTPASSPKNSDGGLQIVGDVCNQK
jgi:hypothetical protein